ncbi:MAG: amidohydrolase [Deltaproteobacteria bacterium]|nr:amidohydrolase [Deltaproteobacteria bacterium]
MDKYSIIDSLCYLPTEEVLVDLVVSTPPQMAGYSNVFGPRATHIYEVEGLDLDKMKRSLPEEELKDIVASKMRKISTPIEEFVGQLDEMGVEKAVIFNMDEETPGGTKGLPNDYYADIVKRYPDKFIGMAGVDPFKGVDAVREIRRCYDLGLRGVSVRPFIFGIPPHHAKMYPIYSTCVELDIPIWLHTSINYSSKTMEVEQPIYLDIVAQDFPELKLIAGHGGWPWMNEMVAVAWRNANVYIDISGYLPKYIGMQGAGWEPLIHFGNSVIQDRILFGSVWILMGMSIKQLAEGVMELPLKEEVKAKWLYHNAARLFGTAY